MKSERGMKEIKGKGGKRKEAVKKKWMKNERINDEGEPKERLEKENKP